LLLPTLIHWLHNFYIFLLYRDQMRGGDKAPGR
jgi:hypothetical protein